MAIFALNSRAEHGGGGGGGGGGILLDGKFLIG